MTLAGIHTVWNDAEKEFDGFKTFNSDKGTAVAVLVSVMESSIVAFDDWSEMEVDLFSADLKLAIEIDGPQHRADPAAYRRDRRKDTLLRESGCHVLRFLADDLGKHVDATLDAILRAIVHLRRKQ